MPVRMSASVALQIQADLIAHCLQVTAATPVHNQTLITTAEQMANQRVPPVEPGSANTQKPFHSPDQFGLCFDHQMKMIGHQTIRMHLPARFDACFTERAEEPLAIFVILEDGLAPISPIHQVINRARIFDSELSRHGQHYANSDCPSRAAKTMGDPYDKLQPNFTAASSLIVDCRTDPFNG